MQNTETSTKFHVMILSAAGATGHLRAADALVSAFAKKGVPSCHSE